MYYYEYEKHSVNSAQNNASKKFSYLKTNEDLYSNFIELSSWANDNNESFAHWDNLR